MSLKVSSAKWRPFCLGLNVLNGYIMHAWTPIKRRGIGWLNTVKYSTLHAIEMYLIIFMLNKPLSETESESKDRILSDFIYGYPLIKRLDIEYGIRGVFSGMATWRNGPLHMGHVWQTTHSSDMPHCSNPLSQISEVFIRFTWEQRNITFAWWCVRPV